MSKQEQILLITPPNLMKENPYEMKTFHGHVCSYCHGNGWTPVLGDRNERESKTCPICNGRKILKAVVTIKWMPDEE